MEKKNIEKLREQIDNIDEGILKLLNKRAKIAVKIGNIKSKDALYPWDPHREKKIFDRLVNLNQGPFSYQALFNIYHEIITATRQLQQPVSVTFLGPEATFSHMAAVKQFGKTGYFSHASSIKDVFLEVEKGRYNYGVVPVENSVEGIVAYTLDMFFQSELKVCGEVYMRISHFLASVTGKRKGIEKIYAHPQAVAQCRNFLSFNFPQIPIYEVRSSAEAAMKAQKEKNVAAITTKLAVEHYKLKFIDQYIEDFANNTTRFWVIGQQVPPSTGADKTSILFSAPDVPGALYQSLKPFAERQINLTKLESRPMKSLPWHYLFFVDLDGHYTDEGVKVALEELRHQCGYFKLLGSYSKVKT
jgi:chorismate mutase/prephenate dehydratase